jgi:hypothetical protein
MKRKTTEEFIEQAVQIHGQIYDYSKLQYIDSSVKVEIICPKHGSFYQDPRGHIAGWGCDPCGYERASKKMSKGLNKFIQEATEKHGIKYGYSKVVYINGLTEVEIICPKHGDFLQKPKQHLRGVGCNGCGAEKAAATHIKSYEQFMLEIKEIHSDKNYDYCRTQYQGSQKNVEIICPYHGSFWISPASLLGGRGCRPCGSEQAAKKCAKPVEVFIAESIETHGNVYDYSKVQYKNSGTEVEIICPKHGSFWKSPIGHLAGQGCQACSKYYQLNTSIFIDRATKIHKNKYDYSKVEYITGNCKIEIICPVHGSFLQKAANHLHGCGCQKCGSKYGIKQEAWLNSLGIPNDKQHRQVTIYLCDGSYIIADGYNPNTNTIYEFWGNKWHGNLEIFEPNQINEICNKPYKTLYNDTLNKIDRIKKSNYALIDIWESEWDRMIKENFNENN